MFTVWRYTVLWACRSGTRPSYKLYLGDFAGTFGVSCQRPAMLKLAPPQTITANVIAQGLENQNSAIHYPVGLAGYFCIGIVIPCLKL